MESELNYEVQMDPAAIGKQSSLLIIGAEDEEFENDIVDPTVDDHCSYFQCFDMLKDRPAHLMAFILHSVLQFECAPVLAYLHADLFRLYSAKESKKQFVDFYHTFLEKGSVLRVSVPSTIAYEFDRTRPDLIPEETQKKYIREIQNFQGPEIHKQLEDFRSKRMMGMTPGERELREWESYRTRDKSLLESKAKQLAEVMLAKMEELQQASTADEEKSTAIFSAVVTYMKHMGVKAKVPDKKSKGGFFRKKITTKTREETIKPKKGLFFPPNRWPLGPSNNFENRPSRVDFEGDKIPERRTSQASKPVDRSEGSSRLRGSVSGAEGQDSSTAPVTINFPPGEHSELDTGPLSLRLGPEGQSSTDLSEPSSKASSDQPVPTEHPPDDSGENESPEPGGSDGGETQLSFLLLQSGDLEPHVSEDNDPPNWRDLVGPETLSRLTKSEIKRQEVINELFMTEHAHVRMLKVLNDVFYQPMLEKALLSSEELKGIFPGLDDLIEQHDHFCNKLKKLRHEEDCIVKEIGPVLLDNFDSPEGQWFQKISSRFCSHQTFALEQIKQKQKKDAHFNSFIQDAERKPQCRRLQLKDIIPIEMQRLTKYPLLLQNIGKCTEQPEEKERVLHAAECCRKILNHVNEKVHQMENLLFLRDCQRRLDTSNLKQTNDPLLMDYKNIDLTQSGELIHSGSLLWRLGREKSIDVTVLLLTNMLVLLQKQDDKLMLKCQSRNNSNTPDMKPMSPIIKLNSSVLTRTVATDKSAFYVITSEHGVHMYELVAQTESEQNQWKEHIAKIASNVKPKASSTTLLPTSPIYSSKLNSPLYNGSKMTYPPLPDDNSKDEEPHRRDPATDEKTGGVDTASRLEQFLLDHNIDPYRHVQVSQMQLASSALEEVSVLKRLLVRNIRLSVEDDAVSPHNSEFPEHSLNGAGNGVQFAADGMESEGNSEGKGETEREGKEEVEDGLGVEGTHKPEWTGKEEEVEKVKEEEGNMDQGCNLEPSSCQVQDLSASQGKNAEGHMRTDDTDGESLSAPIVLSQEQSEEVKKKIGVLESKIKELKLMEEEYCRLHEVLIQFTSSHHIFT